MITNIIGGLLNSKTLLISVDGEGSDGKDGMDAVARCFKCA